MKSLNVFIFVILFLVCTAADCEIGTNPLIFDGATAEMDFDIKTDTTHYSDAAEVDLSDILEDVDLEIERISIFDMTIEVDRLKNTAPSVTIAGTISIDGMVLISMTATPLSAFANERSVFDPSLTTISVNTATVEYIKSILNSGNPPVVIGRARGTGSVQEMEFRARLRIYTQVHANP
jgi:hypothetical protein